MFYVYTLADPRDGAVFYVGKGTKGRIHQHEAEARRGKRSRKCRKIREIWSDGQAVQKRVVKTFESEDAAFQAEIDLIAEIGLDRLTNVLPGGQGKAPPKRKFRWTIRTAKPLAPRISTVVRFLNAGMQVWVLKHDFTPIFRDITKEMREQLGAEAFVKLVGVDLAETV